MFDAQQRGSISQRELYDVLKALALPSCSAAIMHAIGVDAPDIALDWSMFKKLLQLPEYRQSLHHTRNSHNGHYNVRSLEAAVRALSARKLTLDELRAIRLGFTLHDGSGLLPEPRSVNACLKTCQRMIADAELDLWCKEFVSNGNAQIALADFIELSARCQSVEEVAKEAVLPTPRNYTPNARGLYELAHPDFLLHPKKKVKRKIEADYRAKQKKPDTVDFKVVRSAILRSHQGKEKHSVPANLELYQEIKQALQRTQKHIIAARAGGSVSQKIRKEPPRPQARSIRPSTAPATSVHRPARMSKLQLALRSKIQEEERYRPAPTQVPTINDANLTFDAPQSQEEIIQTQESALDPSTDQPSYLPKHHICRPSDAEFFGDGEFSFRGAANINDNDPRQSTDTSSPQPVRRRSSSAVQRVAPPSSRSVSNGSSHQQQQQNTQKPRRPSTSGTTRRPSHTQQRPSTAFAAPSSEKLEQYWNTTRNVLADQNDGRASRASLVSSVLEKWDAEAAAESDDSTQHEQRPSDVVNRAVTSFSMYSDGTGLLERVEEHIDHMYDDQLRPFTAPVNQRPAHASGIPAPPKLGETIASVSRLSFRQTQSAPRPMTPSGGTPRSVFSPRWTIPQQPQEERPLSATAPPPAQGEMADILQRIYHPQANDPGRMLRRRSFEVFRQSLDLNGDLERKKYEAAASYAAARSALSPTAQA